MCDILELETAVRLSCTTPGSCDVSTDVRVSSCCCPCVGDLCTVDGEEKPKKFSRSLKWENESVSNVYSDPYTQSLLTRSGGTNCCAQLFCKLLPFSQSSSLRSSLNLLNGMEALGEQFVHITVWMRCFTSLKTSHGMI